ncbi:MAG: pentapeptide repeat-containing protein [Phycisphaerae bacterium]|nr:pentapeptide repeat-containing protein [Phycisphaerae bacterium]
MEREAVLEWLGGERGGISEWNRIRKSNRLHRFQRPEPPTGVFRKSVAYDGWIPSLQAADLTGAKLKNADLRELDLRDANLHGAELHSANLCRARLRSADLGSVVLQGAKLNGADLRQANLQRANLADAKLEKADLSEAKLRYADLSGARLCRANIRNADLFCANLRGAELQSANLTGAKLTNTILREAHFAGAVLRGADLRGANLFRTDLADSDLESAKLQLAALVQTNFENATLRGCSVYGVSAWQLNLAGADQSDLVISRPGEPAITVDNVEVAQFIHLLLHNEKIRNIIDTITSKVVLLLGRFTPEWKAVLDAMREELRSRDYCPVLFDFETPASRDTHETVTILARMARFVIADITGPKSIPQELISVVETLPSVPVQPLLKSGERPWGMYDHIKRYPWVLDVHEYADTAGLLASLADKVIAPAEGKARELRSSK